MRKDEAKENFGKVLTSMSHTLQNATEKVISSVGHTVLNATEKMADPDSISVQFKALQYSLFSTSFVEVLGGVFFLVSVLYILHDRSNVDRAVAGRKIV